jgi:hypothetical protein
VYEEPDNMEFGRIEGVIVPMKAIPFDVADVTVRVFHAVLTRVVPEDKVKLQPDVPSGS